MNDFAMSAEPVTAPAPQSQAAKRRAIAFLNFAHAIDHFVLLIFPTVVIGLEAVYGRSYGDLLMLSTAAFTAFGLFALFLMAAIFGPALAPYNPLQSNSSMALRPPSAAHWFGTDQLGRDIMSRVIVATRLDLAIAVFSVALVFLLGGVSGVLA